MQHALLRGKRFLIVDDDEACQYLLQLMLQGAGCSFEIAGDGQAGVAKVQAGKFDAVLMDIRMPVMDGYAATRAIRKTHQDLPVIALTGDALAWKDGKCQECGMNDRLIKPFREEQLIALLLKWTGIDPVQGSHTRV